MAQMPERPEQHEIGDQAVGAVTQILKRSGFAVDEISKDYGEDLLVQTSHERRMDASRLWVQVKGTSDVRRHRRSKKSKKEQFSLSVPFGTAMRWIRTIDMVIVVLWDVEREAGWYAVPRRQVDEWQSELAGKESVTLRFGKPPGSERGPASMGVFSREGLDRLVWESRFEHFRMLSLSALDVAREREGMEETELAESRKLALVMREFLHLLALTDPTHTKPGELMVDAGRRQRAVELYTALIHGEFGEPPADVSTQATLVAGRVILERLEEIDPNLGMPAMLFAYASRALALALGLARFLEESPDAQSMNQG